MAAQPSRGGVVEKSVSQSVSQSPELPIHNGDTNGSAGTRSKGPIKVRPAGESGRHGFHPWEFICICFRSSSKASAAANILWPFVPAAIACNYIYANSKAPEHHLVVFILSYLAMVPCANLIGFAGQELSRKMPHAYGVLTETTFGSLVEIILFAKLLSQNLFRVIQAAILGSVLATMLLCLGLCFFFGGLRSHEQSFNEAVSEAGSGLLLVAGFGLAIPTVFRSTLLDKLTEEQLDDKALSISRVTAVLLMIAYFVFVWFQARTHNGIYDAIFEADEARDRDGRKDDHKPKLTLTECVVALVISIALVSLVAIALVDQIENIVHDRHVSDAFMGLILVPVVEKAAEHLTAVDEAWDNQMNFALSHVLGATLQTALFNGPLIVVVGWGLGKPMGLEFELFDIAMLILAIITVGNFLRDQKSNYLEGFLMIIVYIAIAVAAFNYPDPAKAEVAASGESTGGEKPH